MDGRNKMVKTTSGSESDVTIIQVGETSHQAQSQCYIYKVPVKFRSEDEKNTYEPRVVSIGPYHSSGKSFKITAEVKKRYLRDLISRDKQKNDPSVFVKAIIEVAKDACACYAEPIEPTKEFIEMMLLDGCFILELLFKFSEKIAVNKRNKWKTQNDPIFDSTWMVYSLRRDLVLLENQLPFIVLKKLFDLSNYYNPEKYTLSGFITTFFKSILPTMEQHPKDSSFQGHHILDLLRSCLVSKLQHSKPVAETTSWEYTHCVTDLWERGVTFKKKNPSNGFLNVTFANGVLAIPPFYFGESWTILMPNLIALEQCRGEYKDQITSYVILLDSFINSADDVKMLRRKKIIDEMYQEDEKVANEINYLVKGVFVDVFHYDRLCNRVNKYCRTRHNTFRATMMHDYFNTPCKTISFIAAATLLVLTMAQTTLAFLSYFRPPKA